jgi:hypothetical protein
LRTSFPLLDKISSNLPDKGESQIEKKDPQREKRRGVAKRKEGSETTKWSLRGPRNLRKPLKIENFYI